MCEAHIAQALVQALEADPVLQEVCASHCQCFPLVFPMLAPAVPVEGTGEAWKVEMESPQPGGTAVQKT